MEPNILECYLSLFILEMVVSSDNIEEPFYLLETDFEKLDELYTKKENKIQCFSKKDFTHESPLVMEALKNFENEDKSLCHIILVDNQYKDRVKTILVNPYHLFCGINHCWPIQDSFVYMTMLEKKIFTESKIETKFYNVDPETKNVLEPIITDSKIRNYIILEILYQHYQTNSEIPKEIIQMTFRGDKHMINIWRKGLDLGEWLFILDSEKAEEDVLKIYQEKEPEENVILLTVLNPKTDEVIVKMIFKHNLKDIFEKKVTNNHQ